MRKLIFTILIFSINLSFGQDGALDSSFNANGSQYVRAIQKLSNGNIICTYSISSTGGISVFNSDGSNNSLSFGNTIVQSGTSENYVQDIVEQPDGKIIFVGSFNAPKVFRFNPNGTIDNSFQSNLGTGANNKVRKAIVDSNGKITLIGNFTSFNGSACGGIIRLNSDGTIDNTFNSTGTTSSTGISDIILTSDNKYILSGENISVYNGQSTYSKTVRLNYNGSIDTTFQAPMDASFIRIGLLSNGQLIGVGKYNIKKLNANGTDTGFGSSILQGNSASTPYGLHVQADDKVIITGIFNKIGTNTVNNIVRIDVSGSSAVIDTTFNPSGTGPSHGILCSQLTDDGKILIGGEFYLYNGIARNYIARLNNDTAPLTLENLISTGINKLENEEELSIFPNPTSSFININNSTNSTYTIYDLYGKEVLKGQLSASYNSINVKTLKSGLYFFVTEQQILKFIKQ